MDDHRQSRGGLLELESAIQEAQPHVLNFLDTFESRAQSKEDVSADLCRRLVDLEEALFTDPQVCLEERSNEVASLAADALSFDASGSGEIAALRTVASFLRRACHINGVMLPLLDNHLKSHEFDLAAEVDVAIRDELVLMEQVALTATCNANSVLFNEVEGEHEYCAGAADQTELSEQARKPPRGMLELALVRKLRLQFLERHSYLETELSGALERFIDVKSTSPQVCVWQRISSSRYWGTEDNGDNFSDRGDDQHEPGGGVDFADVLHAWSILGRMPAKIEEVIVKLRKHVVGPLLDAAIRCAASPTRGIICQTSQVAESSGPTMVQWSFVTENSRQTGGRTVCAKPESENSWQQLVTQYPHLAADANDIFPSAAHPSPQEIAVPAIRHLLTFCFEDMFKSDTDARDLFIRKLWASISKRLVSDLPYPSSSSSAQVLSCLENYLRSLGVKFSSSRGPLSKAATKMDADLERSQRIHLLDTLRNKFLAYKSDPLSSSMMSSSILNDYLKSAFPTPTHPDVKLAASVEDTMSEAVNDKTAECDPVTLSRCSVSDAAFFLVRVLYFLYRQAIHVANPRRGAPNTLDGGLRGEISSFSDVAPNFVPPTTAVLRCKGIAELCRQAVQIFVLVRPLEYKQNVDTHPDASALFFADCSFVCHHLTVLDFRLGHCLPRSVHESLVFFDLVLAVRHVQEAVYTTMMKEAVNKVRHLLLCVAKNGDVSSVETPIRSMECKHQFSLENEIEAQGRNPGCVARTQRKGSIRNVIPGVAAVGDFFGLSLASSTSGISGSESLGNLLGHLSMDACYTTAEAAVATGLQYVKETITTWKAVLPSQVSILYSLESFHGALSLAKRPHN
eukprot:GHVT01025976.1.p1 GENE.GHVT01025976.1~~GHVT01025976.1.p1  ORF type:complete len:854 (+),score=92.29 GHVT01025976.1:573-3134(+)